MVISIIILIILGGLGMYWLTRTNSSSHQEDDDENKNKNENENENQKRVRFAETPKHANDPDNVVVSDDDDEKKKNNANSHLMAYNESGSSHYTENKKNDKPLSLRYPPSSVSRDFVVGPEPIEARGEMYQWMEKQAKAIRNDPYAPGSAWDKWNKQSN